MNDILWTAILETKLDLIDIYNRSRVVVHSTHRNKVTFELRSRQKNVVVFGTITNANSERIMSNLETELNEAYQKLLSKLA